MYIYIISYCKECLYKSVFPESCEEIKAKMNEKEFMANTGEHKV